MQRASSLAVLQDTGDPSSSERFPTQRTGQAATVHATGGGAAAWCGPSAGNEGNPSSNLPPIRRTRQHLHSPSVASTVFDDSDGSSDERDLARRSARMQPRSVLPAAPSTTAAAAAFPPPSFAQGDLTQRSLAAQQAQQQQQLLVLLQLQQQVQQQLLGQQGMHSQLLVQPSPPFQPDPGYEPAASEPAASEAAPLVVRLACESLSLEHAASVRPGTAGARTDPDGTDPHGTDPDGAAERIITDAGNARGCGQESTTGRREELQELYLRRWSGVSPYEPAASPQQATRLRPPAPSPRPHQQDSIAVCGQPAGGGVSCSDTAALGHATAQPQPPQPQGMNAGAFAPEALGGGGAASLRGDSVAGASSTLRMLVQGSLASTLGGPSGHVPVENGAGHPTRRSLECQPAGVGGGLGALPHGPAPAALMHTPSLASPPSALAPAPFTPASQQNPHPYPPVNPHRPLPPSWGGMGAESRPEERGPYEGGTGCGGDSLRGGTDADANADVRLKPGDRERELERDGGKLKELEAGEFKDREREQAVPSADQVVENLENIEALALFNPDEEEDEDGEEDELPPPWYRHPGVLWFLGSVGLGLLLLVVGVILQNVLVMSSDAFRWFYFFAGMPLLYYIVSYTLRRAFMVIEWWFFRESLFYLRDVQHKAAWLLFFLGLLPWFCAMFRWTWCSGVPSSPRRCQSPAYVKATGILWNCLLCLMLFSLANLLKAVLAKLLTTHFYRTAHFEKLKKALEKEYVLQVLSRPRRLVLLQRSRSHAHPHAGADGWFSMSMFHHGPASSQRRMQPGPAGGEVASGAPAGLGTAAADVEVVTPTIAPKRQGDGKPVSKAAGAVAGGAEHAGVGAASAVEERGATVTAAAAMAVTAAEAVGAGPAAGGRVPRLALAGIVARRSVDLRGQQPSTSNPLYGHPEQDTPTSHPSQASVSMSLTSVASVASRAPSLPPHQAHGGEAAACPPAGAPAPAITAPATAAPEPALPSGSPGPRPATSLLRRVPALPAGRAPAVPAVPPGGGSMHTRLTPRGRGRAAAQVGPTDPAGAGDAGTSLSPRAAARGLGLQMLRRQDSRASRISKASALKAAAKAPAAGAPKKVEEALSQAMVEVVPPGNGLTAQKGLHLMTEAELEMVRTAIVIKTQTALISKYANKSEEDMEKELGRVKRFAKALYFNVLPPGAGRAHLVVEDLLPFFEGRDDSSGVGGGGEGSGGGGIGAGGVAGSPVLAPSASRGGGGGDALARKSVNLAAMSTPLGGAAGAAKMAAAKAAERARMVRRQQAEAAARKAFAVFDADGNGEVSRPEVREAVVNIYKERRNMARSLMDTETIVKSLEFGIGVVIHFVFAAVYLLIWGVDLLTGFSTFSATVLALTFIFGNSVKNMYESMLFLFVTHPYDVGDHVLIGADTYRVKKISLLYTDMVRGNGERVYIPNTVLISQNITNLTRSRTKSESCRLVCDVGVAWEVREDIQAALRAYAREHPGEFDGEPSCNFRELADPLKVVLLCSWTYNFAPDEFSRLGPARNGMLFVVQQKAREHRLAHTAAT